MGDTWGQGTRTWDVQVLGVDFVGIGARGEPWGFSEGGSNGSGGAGVHLVWDRDRARPLSVFCTPEL